MYLFLDIYLEANGTLKRNRKFLQLPSSAGQYFTLLLRHDQQIYHYQQNEQLHSTPNDGTQ
jgi:hypothetical protein